MEPIAKTKLVESLAEVLEKVGILPYNEVSIEAGRLMYGKGKEIQK